MSEARAPNWTAGVVDRSDRPLCGIQGLELNALKLPLGAR
jgi:hypothetical protein